VPSGGVKWLPQPPAYAALPNSVSTALRAQMASTPPPGIGDVNKMTRALLDLAAADPKTVPTLRVVLGSDAWAAMRKCARKTLEEIEGDEDRAHSTNRDGVDGKASGEAFAQSLAKMFLLDA
jgi:hypothetical protein